MNATAGQPLHVQDEPAQDGAAADQEGLPQAPRLGDVTVTTLVHRGSRGPAPWWHSAVVYQIPGELDAEDIAASSGEVSHLARLGAEVLQLHAPTLDPTEGPGREAADLLLRRAHQRCLKVVPSVAGSDAPDGAADARWHLARARAWLARGADGIDLLTAEAVPGPGPHEHRAVDIGALQAALAERSEDAVLTGAAAAADAEGLVAHLEEDWLHITRDDRLAVTPWHAEDLRATITDSYTRRDAIGVPAAWSLHGFSETGDVPAWAEGGDVAARRRAATLLMLALPGVTYLRQGDAVGLEPGGSAAASTVAVARAAQEQRGDLSSPFEHYRLALRLRHELRLGTGHLAWLDDASGADALVFVNRSVLVVLNFGDTPVQVPTRREVLHASSPLGPPVDGYVLVPRDTTVWFSLES